VKVFISSVIAGMEDHRAAAREAAESLGYTVIAAEDFRASPRSPQQACLEGVRDADVVVLVLGERYGTPQRSGLSPTHEEYRRPAGPSRCSCSYRLAAPPSQTKRRSSTR